MTLDFHHSDQLSPPVRFLPPLGLVAHTVDLVVLATARPGLENQFLGRLGAFRLDVGPSSILDLFIIVFRLKANIS